MTGLFVQLGQNHPKALGTRAVLNGFFCPTVVVCVCGYTCVCGCSCVCVHVFTLGSEVSWQIGTLN